jgi:lipopolysaccharide transport system permease protein
MSAAYLDPTIQFDPLSRMAHVEFAIRNDSAEIWRPAEGFCVGYQVFDAETGGLITEGARVAPERELGPGESARLRMIFHLPAEEGRYQVFVSPLRENVCWDYERDCPFLLIEGATVAGTLATTLRWRVSTKSRLRRARARRAGVRALVYPVVTIWRNRGLIRAMVRHDILGRYRGSFGGIFWAVINPLLLMLTYFFVFGVVLETRFGTDPSRSAFALYFLAGMLPWLAFSEAAGRSAQVMVEHRNFVKKLVFAVETLPVNLVVSGLVSECFLILLFGVFLLAARGGLPLSLVWLPLVVVPQILFTAGVSWFVAALGVFVRDLAQVIGLLLTLWFFLTPICYPESSLPPQFAPLFAKNPIYVLVRSYRAILLEGRPPDFGGLWKLWLVAAAVFVLGHAWFYKLRKSFPDII